MGVELVAKLLFETTDRDAAHARLEKEQKKNSKSECREDANAEKPYQVWDGPEAKD